MKIIQHARLVGVLKSTITAETRSLFKARMRVGGKRTIHYLICDPTIMTVAMVNASVIGADVWVVEHKHGATPAYHTVLFEGEDV